MNPSKLTYQSQAAETAAEKMLTEHIGYYTVNNDRCWRIKWRGNFIHTSSGKASWSKIGHAKAAFKHHIAACNLAFYYERAITGNDKLRYCDQTISDEAFFKIIEPEVEFVPA